MANQWPEVQNEAHINTLRKCCELMKATRSGDPEGQKIRLAELGPLNERTGKKMGLRKLVRIFCHEVCSKPKLLGPTEYSSLH